MRQDCLVGGRDRSSGSRGRLLDGVSPGAANELVRSLRPAKLSAQRSSLDLSRPLGIQVEQERDCDGSSRAATLFLAGAECPFACVFCDLWRYTTLAPTPAGAIPRQIERGIESLSGLGVERLKLYNASNFFDSRAVPPVDDHRILELIEPFERVIVECHPRLIGRRCFEYASALGSRLEVALGLETAEPEALARLNKGVRLHDFDRAVERLGRRGVGVRAFVLVGVPFVETQRQLEWTERSVSHALSHGARAVSLIPVRGGNGELERLAGLGEWQPPDLRLIERALDAVVADSRGVVTLDLWELERFSRCPYCWPDRLERLRAINRSGTIQADVACLDCAESAANDGLSAQRLEARVGE